MERKIKENLIFSGKVLKFYNDDVVTENNIKCTREIVKHPGGVGILVIKDNEVYLVKQYRYVFQKEVIEIPAGKLEGNEDHLLAAQRELNEELGLVSSSLKYLGEFYPSVGYTNEIIYLYYVNNFTKENQHLDIDEDLDIVKMSLEEFDNKIKNNEIKDGKTIAAYHLYKSKF